MNGPTQNQKVLALLRSRGERGLTPREALDLVGSMRLAARVSDIRGRTPGVPPMIADAEEVVTEYVTQGDATFARYVLRKRSTPDVVQTALWS